jgi:hypothetical protein
MDILASIELEKADTARLRLKDFFWDTSEMQAARRIRTGMILVGVAYLMGIDMIFYYMNTIFQVYIGLAPLVAGGLAGAATTVLAIANYTGVYFMERLGRRVWLIGGAAGQTVFLAIFTGLLSAPGPRTGAAAAAMLFCWIAVFAPTWGPVTVSKPNNYACHDATADTRHFTVCLRFGDYAASLPSLGVRSQRLRSVDHGLHHRLRRSHRHR